jgi:DNA-binding CsgD family transcriptional regulator/predicted DNA-binding protein YlxM (UPF0122 family)
MSVKKKKSFTDTGRAPYAHLLGAIPDAEIAKKYKITVSSVTGARLRRGIAPAVRKIEYEKMLGVFSDAEIAARYGVAKSAVRYARQQRGIPAFRKYAIAPADYEGVLDTLSASEIAKKYDVSASAVIHARRRRGIPAPKQVRELPYEQFLGVLPDREIARRYGASPGTVNYHRRARGIDKAPSKYSQKYVSNKYTKALGIMSDKNIAEKFGIDISTVVRARKRRGIAAAPGGREKNVTLSGPAPRLAGLAYQPPDVRMGDWIEDVLDGLVQVGAWSEARISWPCRKQRGQRSVIFCGALVEAAKNETAAALVYWFGISIKTAYKWRDAVNV